MITLPNRTAEFRSAFLQKRWVMDGAMATMLFAKGASSRKPVEELNLTLPALVRDVHREYLAAGAEILRTNTFGANRVRLAQMDLAARLAEINRAAVRIARTVAGDQAFVAGLIGPTGVRLVPLGSLTEEEARGVYRQQAAALVGVDLFILETFRDVAELGAAIDGVREAAGDEVIIIAQVSVEDDGRLQDGTPPERYGTVLNELAVDAVGINCSSGPYAVFNALASMRPHVPKPLSASPGAGFPAACSPEYFASRECNVHIAGGCCGTTPEHIRQLRAAFDSSIMEPPQAQLAAGDCAPLWPRGLASTCKLEWHTGEIANTDAVLYVAARGRSATDLQRDLLTVHALGQRAIVCLTGTGWGTLDIDSIGLTHIAAGLNQGHDFGGNPISATTAFTIGVGVNPNAQDLDREIARLEAKVKAGAQFAVTQPIFDIALFEAFLKRIEHFAIPVITTVWPIVDIRTAEYAMNELHIPIPQPILDRISAGEALAASEEIAAALRPISAGLRKLN